MTLPSSLIIAVARAVEREGGDLEDVRDLLEVWERLAADPHGRQDRLHAENRKRQDEALAEGPAA